jgi:hypothetical protein
MPIGRKALLGSTNLRDIHRLGIVAWWDEGRHPRED